MTQELKIENHPPTLRGLALDRLRNAIISGHFKSGERLVERVLCDQLGVSRSIVREAICFLEADGLVEIVPRSGPIVARLDWRQAKQIYDIRLLLEQQAAITCAERADAAAKTTLQAALTSIKAAFAGEDATDRKQAIYAATTHFYKVIFATAGHDIAWEIVHRLNGRISRLRALTLATTDRSVSGPSRMTRICDAIVAGDSAAAGQAVHDHLTEAAAIARRVLESEADEGRPA